MKDEYDDAVISFIKSSGFWIILGIVIAGLLLLAGVVLYTGGVEGFKESYNGIFMIAMNIIFAILTMVYIIIMWTIVKGRTQNYDKEDGYGKK